MSSQDMDSSTLNRGESSLHGNDSSSTIATADIVIEKLNIVQFDGSDDNWDPKNFSELKKWIVLFAVTHGAVIVTCTSSIYVPISKGKG
jgi:hypothetical protein